MPAYACAGGCVRMISVSNIPGGNPVAKNDPENWAVNYGRCETCKAHWCDRCLAKLPAPECPQCKTKLTMLGVTPEPPKPSAEPPATGSGQPKPWWKFW